MENLTNWLVETKPTNKYLAWLLLALLKDGSTFQPSHYKWVYKSAFDKLRLPNREYSARNSDWYDDCMDLIKIYRELYKK